MEGKARIGGTATAATAAVVLALLAPVGAVAAKKKADLIVSAIGNPPATVDAGKGFSLSSTVKNKGKKKAKASSVTFHLSLDAKVDDSDVSIGSSPTPALKPKKSSTADAALDVPGSVKAGVYSIVGCADGGNAVKEKKETNNCRASTGSVRVTTAVPPIPPDTTPPGAPTITDTDPPSPANDDVPEVKGNGAEAGSLVSLYGTLDCTGIPIGGGTAADFNGATGISVTVPSDQTSQIRAVATDGAGNRSPCSSPIAYTEDSTSPTAPTITGTTPGSPSSNGSPAVQGSGAEAGSTVRIYATAGCAGAPLATGTAALFNGAGITTPVPADQTTSLRATATDAAGNASACSVTGFDYTEDSTAPGAPLLVSTSPLSPSNGDTDPIVNGTGEADQEVNLYLNVACTGPPAVVENIDNAGNFAVEVTVPANATTQIRATVTDSADNTSSCSNALSYTHDNVLPAAVVIDDTDPDDPGNDLTPNVKGTGAEADSTITLFQQAGCTGPQAGAVSGADFDDPGITSTTINDNATTTFSALQTDAAGNVSPCSNDFNYTHDGQAPTAPSIDSTNPASPSFDNTPQVNGSTGPGTTLRIYLTGNCTGPVAATGPSGAGSFSIQLPGPGVPSNATTNMSAEAVDGANNASACSAAFPYTHDSVTPNAPVVTSTQPASPSPNQSPNVVGTAEPGSTVNVFIGNCSGGSLGNDVADGSGDWIVTGVNVPDNATSQLRAAATDEAGNVSGCAIQVPYTHDDQPPPTPILSAFSPASSTDNTPAVQGTQTGDAVTVRLHHDTSCGGPVIGTGTPGQLNGAGIDPTTPQRNGFSQAYSAAALDAAGNVSTSCSNAVVHTEHRDQTATAETDPSNNSPTTALDDPLVIVEDELISGSSSADPDFFQVLPPAPRLMRFEMFSDASGTDCALPIGTGILGIFVNGIQVASNNDDGISNCPAITRIMDPSAGTLHLGSTAPANNYVIEARTLRDAGDEAEPNDTPATATQFPDGNDNYVTGTFTQPVSQDIDAYRLTVPAGPNLSARIEITNQPGSPTTTCSSNLTTVELRDNGGAVLLAADSSTENGQCGLIDGTGTSPLHPGAHLLAPGNYTVRAFNSSAGIWPYALAVTLRSP